MAQILSPGTSNVFAPQQAANPTLTGGAAFRAANPVNPSIDATTGKQVYAPMSSTTGNGYVDTSTGQKIAAPIPSAYGNLYSQISSANNTPTGTNQTPVINASMAQNDLATKFNVLQQAIAGMNNQADIQSRQAQQAKVDQAMKDYQTAQTAFQQQGLNVQQTQADAAKIAAQAKQQATQSLTIGTTGTTGTQTGATTGTTDTTGTTGTTGATTGGTTGTTGTSGNQIQPSQDTLNYIQNVQGVQDERTTALNSFLQTSQNMIIGLQDSEAALVNATTQQFQSIIQAQQLANASQVGQATEAAARTGQEYAPTQAGSTIANVIAQGNLKLSEINSTMAKTISDLQMNFSKEEYGMITKNFDALDKSFTDRMTAFKDVHDAVAQDAATQQKAAIDKRDFQYKQQQDQQNFQLEQQKMKMTEETNAVDRQYKQAEIAKLYNDINAAKTGGSNVASISDGMGGTAMVPVDVAPYYNKASNGVEYIDASTLQGTAKEKTNIINQATAAGYKVITNKNTAADLVNIKDVKSKLDTIKNTMANIAQPGWVSRIAGGLGLTYLQTVTESDPQKAAAGVLQSVGLDILKGISGVQGFRGNQTAIQQISDHLPKITDTVDVVNQKIDYVNQLLNDRENAAVGKAQVKDTGVDQTVNGVTYSKGADGLYYPKK
jgi:hypothetical protein